MSLKRSKTEYFKKKSSILDNMSTLSKSSSLSYNPFKKSLIARKTITSAATTTNTTTTTTTTTTRKSNFTSPNSPYPSISSDNVTPTYMKKKSRSDDEAIHLISSTMGEVGRNRSRVDIRTSSLSNMYNSSTGRRNKHMKRCALQLNPLDLEEDDDDDDDEITAYFVGNNDISDIFGNRPCYNDASSYVDSFKYPSIPHNKKCYFQSEQMNPMFWKSVGKKLKIWFKKTSRYSTSPIQTYKTSILDTGDLYIQDEMAVLNELQFAREEEEEEEVNARNNDIEYHSNLHYSQCYHSPSSKCL